MIISKVMYNLYALANCQAYCLNSVFSCKSKSVIIVPILKDYFTLFMQNFILTYFNNLYKYILCLSSIFCFNSYLKDTIYMCKYPINSELKQFVWKHKIENTLLPRYLSHAQFMLLILLGSLKQDGADVSQNDLDKFLGFDVKLTSQALPTLEKRRLIKPYSNKGVHS